ncbi:MAG: PIN domain-containing protein [Saprospiraceae bacterium]
MSVVTVGEIRSFAGNASWGADKLLKLEELLAELQVVDLQPGPISDRYAEIDIFSQGNLPGNPLGQSARNMGKNDLWIAATASLLGAKLLTTDADFDHLNGVFLDLERILT